MDFSTIIKQAHSGVAYLALIFLLIVVINAFAGLAGKKEFTEKDRKLGLFGLIFTHIQLLLGLILYFVSPMVQSFGVAMKDSMLRLYALEHPLINIIAIVLITIGWSKHKKATDSNAKFKKFAIFYALGLILILSRIPWSAWL
ncbi:hypothetical protein [Myroides phaeus]|uniref:50S ribosomal protein L27 n=1 Tax=Myroides phaeus TaxID=702745 RepID=A0A1G8G0W8_9FLAO|nr:hypothetical protein [Myroides phaeus]MEC4116496.1 hypothetical protein [Myroides phaeus]SDH87998.1 hypothetical protein SAMN05421818_12125 [Myroides phaeus]